MGKHVDGFNGVYGGYGVGRKSERKRSADFCLDKDLSNMWFRRDEK